MNGLGRIPFADYADEDPNVIPFEEDNERDPRVDTFGPVGHRFRSRAATPGWCTTCGCSRNAHGGPS